MPRRIHSVDGHIEEPTRESGERDGNENLYAAVKALIENFLPYVGTWMPDDMERFRHILHREDIRDAIRVLERHRALCLALVQSRGMFLMALSPELRGDREIVRQACLEDARALRYASQELRLDKELVSELLRKTKLSIGDVIKSTPLKRDPEVASLAARLHGHWALDSIPKTTRRHPDVAKAALQFRNFDAGTFVLLPKHLQGKLSQDRKIMLQVIRKSPSNVLLASDQLLADREFLLAAIRLNGEVFSWLAGQKKPDITEDLEFAETAVRKDARQFDRVDHTIRKQLLRKLPVRLRRKIRTTHGT